jgi:hypothetical protein
MARRLTRRGVEVRGVVCSLQAKDEEMNGCIAF